MTHGDHLPWILTVARGVPEPYTEVLLSGQTTVSVPCSMSFPRSAPSIDVSVGVSVSPYGKPTVRRWHAKENFHATLTRRSERRFRAPSNRNPCRRPPCI